MQCLLTHPFERNGEIRASLVRVRPVQPRDRLPSIDRGHGEPRTDQSRYRFALVVGESLVAREYDDEALRGLRRTGDIHRAELGGLDRPGGRDRPGLGARDRRL